MADRFVASAQRPAHFGEEDFGRKAALGDVARGARLAHGARAQPDAGPQRAQIWPGGSVKEGKSVCTVRWLFCAKLRCKEIA